MGIWNRAILLSFEVSCITDNIYFTGYVMKTRGNSACVAELADAVSGS